MNQPYWIIDGNLLSGTITSTTNGDCVGCLTTTQSVGINVSAANVEIKNLNIGPMFQRSATDTSANGNATAGIRVNQVASFTADGNNISNAFMPIYVIYQTMTSLSIYNNTTDYSSHHIVAGDNAGSASLTGCNIYSNTLGPHFDIWQDSPAGSSTMHADGIFVFAGNTASSATCNIYNNYITGDMCTRSNLNCTGYIYLDGNNNSWVFNNRVQHIPSTGDGPEGGMVQRATANAYSGNHFVNNTFIGATQTNALQFKIGTTAHPGTNLTAENNIWSTGRYGYGFGANNFNELGTSDYNIFYSESAAVATKGVDSSPTNYVTLANWQSASSKDAHSVFAGVVCRT